MRNTFAENWAVRTAFLPGTVPQAATLGTWIDVTGLREIAFVGQVAALDGNVALQVMQNGTNDADGNEVVVTGATDTFVNGTDEDRVGVISFGVEDLAAGNNWVALRVTPAGSALPFFGAVAHLGSAYSSPVLNGTAEGVAWVVDL